MKNFRILLVAVLVFAGFTANAGDVFRFGPRVGMEVNSMRLNSSLFDDDNRAGFTGGVMMEVNVPLIGLGFDLSVMYCHRVNANTVKDGANIAPDESTLLASDSYRKRDYIEIPLNLKYKIGLPVVGKVFTPYIFTGPSFAFLTSRRAINEAFKNKAFDVAWNFGLGFQLFNHLQVGASYGLGITKSVAYLTPLNSGTKIEGKNNYWTVTAAWLF